MTTAVYLYDNVAKRVFDATNLLDPAGTYKITLHTSGYTFDATDSIFSDVSNELSTAFGYTNGGQALTNVVVTKVGNDAKFDFDDPLWTATGGTIAAWRGAIIRRVGTINGFVDPLIAYILGDTAGGGTDVPATTNTNVIGLTVDTSGFILGTVT